MEAIKEIYALGVGCNTPVFIDIAEACGYKVIGMYHYNEDKTEKTEYGIKILGSFSDLYKRNDLSKCNFILTMGDNKIRSSVFNTLQSLGANIPTLIHPFSQISRFASIDSQGVIISPFSYIQANSTINANTIILSHVNISHNTKIGKHCFFAGNSTVGAYTKVEDFVFWGQGALSISSKVPIVGTHAYIGARSVITRNVPAFSTVCGSPAKVIKKGDRI